MKVYEAITVILADRVTNLSTTKWNKLMFFIDGAGYCIRGKQFTNFQYIAIQFGPVPKGYSEILEKIAANRFIDYKSYNAIPSSANFITLVNRDQHIVEAQKAVKKEKGLSEIIEGVIDLFEGWTAVSLSDFSHALDAWKLTDYAADIDMSLLTSDPYLESKTGEENWGEYVLAN